MSGLATWSRAAPSPRLLCLVAAAPLWLLTACAKPTPTLAGCGDGHILTLPSARVGQAYVRAALVRGGVPPYVGQVTSGSLQAVGLSLAADGQLAGVPVAEGDVVFCVQAREAVGSRAASQAYRVTVLPRGPAP